MRLLATLMSVMCSCVLLSGCGRTLTGSYQDQTGALTVKFQEKSRCVWDTSKPTPMVAEIIDSKLFYSHAGTKEYKISGNTVTFSPVDEDTGKVVDLPSLVLHGTIDSKGQKFTVDDMTFTKEE